MSPLSKSKYSWPWILQFLVKISLTPTTFHMKKMHDPDFNKVESKVSYACPKTTNNVSAQIEIGHSIKIYDIFAVHIGNFWYKLSKKDIATLDNFYKNEPLCAKKVYPGIPIKSNVLFVRIQCIKMLNEIWKSFFSYVLDTWNHIGLKFSAMQLHSYLKANDLDVQGGAMIPSLGE